MSCKVKKKNISIVHINKNILLSNIKHNKRNPPICIRKNKSRTYTNEIELVVDGKVIGGFIYSHDKPLDCGAKIYFWCNDENVTLKIK